MGARVAHLCELCALCAKGCPFADHNAALEKLSPLEVQSAEESAALSATGTEDDFTNRESA